MSLFSRLFRSRTATATILGWSYRIFQIVFQILSVRLIIELLGTSQYAAVVLISGLMPWISNFEFGISYSLMNRYSEIQALDRSTAGLKFFGLAAYAILTVVGIVVVTIVSPLVAPSFLKAVDLSDRSGTFAVATYVMAFVATGMIGTRLLFAQDRAGFSYFLNIVAILASGGAIALMYCGILPISVLSVLVATFLPIGLTGAIGIASAAKGWDAKTLTRADVTAVVGKAVQFLVLVIITGGVVQIDTFIISQKLNSHDISTYGIFTRIFSAINVMINTPLSVIWPKISALAIKKDIKAIRKIINIYVISSTGILIVIGLGVSVFWVFIIRIMAPGQSIKPPSGFIFALTALQILIFFNGAFLTALQSMGAIKFLLIMTPMQAVISAVCQIFLVDHFGMVGITGGVIASYLALPIWLVPLYFARKTRTWTVADQPV